MSIAFEKRVIKMLNDYLENKNNIIFTTLMLECDDLPVEKTAEYGAALSQYKREAAAVDALVEALPEKERIVINGRFMSEPGKTCKELCEIIGYTRQSVIRLKNRAIKRMAKTLENVCKYTDFPVNS